MRKVFGVAAMVLVVAASVAFVRYTVEAGQDRGRQIIDAYADKAARGREKVKFHLALKLMTGAWNDQQRQIILRAMRDPTAISESEVAGAFSHADVGDVFYRIGSVDVSDLTAVYGLAFGKAPVVAGWHDDARRVRVWQMNFALGVVRYGLNDEQIGYLVDLSAALPGVDRESARDWDARAALLFSREVGRGLLTTIGDDRCPGQIASLDKGVVLPTCLCTTNAGNWSCNDTCHGAGSCSVDPGNCGILWLYDCNGMCDNSEIQ